MDLQEEAYEAMIDAVDRVRSLEDLLARVEAVNAKFLDKLEAICQLRATASLWRLVLVSSSVRGCVPRSRGPAILREGSLSWPDADEELVWDARDGAQMICLGRHTEFWPRCVWYVLHPLLCPDLWPATLEALMALLVEGNLVLQAGLPTYGGEPPAVLEQVWSWDVHDVLVGPAPHQLELVDRASWREMF